MTSDGPRKIVFFGSPPAAVVVAERLVEAGHEIVGAVTQPPRRRGRGGAQSPTAVEEWAVRRGVTVVHTSADAGQWLEGCDLGVVVAYGRIIPARLLALCPMLNVHFSLLPRWRGAAPVERAILAGDVETGVSIMELEETLDTGPTFATRSTAIRADDTAASLTSRLAALGAEALIEVLATVDPEKVAQTGEVSYADKIDPAECVIDWSGTSIAIERQIRALDAWCWVGDRRLKVRSCSCPTDPQHGHDSSPTPATGTVMVDGRVRTGDGWLVLGRVQPEGKRAMDVSAWLSGLRPTGSVVLTPRPSLR